MKLSSILATLAVGSYALVDASEVTSTVTFNTTTLSTVTECDSTETESLEFTISETEIDVFSSFSTVIEDSFASASYDQVSADSIFSPAIYDPRSIIPFNSTVRYYDWNVTVEVNNLDGRYRDVFLINNQSPGPQLEGDQGDWVVIHVNNFSPVPITLHWHGIHQKNTPWADGSAGITQFPVLSGDDYLYVFKLDQYGFYWYHSHYRGYASDGLSGTIYIRPGPDVPRPYESVSSDPEDIALFYELEKNPQRLTFRDQFKDSYDLVAAKMFDYGMDPTCVRSILTNGKGRQVCIEDSIKVEQAAKKTDKLAATIQGITGASEPPKINIDSYGCLDLDILNGFTSFDYDKSGLEFPGYNTDCANASTDREIIYTNDQKWIYLNIINLGGEFAKLLSIDDHNLTVIAVDGVFIEPVEGQNVLLPIGQRVTALVKTDSSEHDDVSQPFGIRTAVNDMPQILEGLAYLQYGTVNSTNSTDIQKVVDPSNGLKFQNLAGELINGTTSFPLSSIDAEIQKPLDKSNKVPTGAADVTLLLILNRLGQTTFSVLNDTTMNGGMELDYPALFRVASDRKINLTETIDKTLIDQGIKSGDVVDVIFQNTPLADHPLHMHGHTFWKIAANNDIATFNYSSVGAALADGQQDLFNFEDPPLLDTVAIGTGGYAIVRFIADNPGVWMIHCHIQTHLSAGMAAAFVEAKDEIPQLPYNLYLQGHANFDSAYDQTPSELSVVRT